MTARRTLLRSSTLNEDWTNLSKPRPPSMTAISTTKTARRDIVATRSASLRPWSSLSNDWMTIRAVFTRTRTSNAGLNEG